MATEIAPVANTTPTEKGAELAIDLEDFASGAGGRSKHDPKLAARITKLLKKGNRLSVKHEYRLALAYHFAAWQLDYENPDSVKCLAHTLGQLGERAKAIHLFEILMRLNPGDPDMAGLVGQLAIDLEMWEQAAALNRIYIRLKPDNDLGYNNLATALRHMERFDEAIALLKDVLPMFPESAALWNTLGSAVSFRDGIEAALPFYEEALRLNPGLWHALNNLGRGFYNIGAYDKVVHYCERANAAKLANKDQHQSHVGLAMGYLALGRLREGWQEYEWRQDPSRNTAIRWTHGLRRWQGEDLAGKSILVCPEQGVGDEILFAACFPDLLGEGAQVYIGAEKRLVSLFQRSFPTAAQIGDYRDISNNAYRYRDMAWVRELERPIDYYIEAGSLNKFYRNRLEDFPHPGGGHLVPDPARVAFWRQRLEQRDGSLKVGICWRSGLRNADRNVWYTALADWAPIFAARDCSFVNLQYGDCAEELAMIKDRFGVAVADWEDIDLKNDLDEVAALTRACDVVVTIGAAPGMMAMAVDRPVLWMFPFPVWWAFGQAPKTPLHARSRLFCCAKPGDWRPVTQAVAERLALAAAKPGVIDEIVA
ncbi:MAG: tetratricopeptide repeat protein [Alphaproteobacteria bacterium]|nr:MAG: tetratricopeptide repeat protein [Alphaproteobacteria bacterium]